MLAKSQATVCTHRSGQFGRYQKLLSGIWRNARCSRMIAARGIKPAGARTLYPDENVRSGSITYLHVHGHLHTMQRVNCMAKH